MAARWLVCAVLAAPVAVVSIGQSQGIAQSKNNLVIHLGLALLLWSLTSWWLRAITAWSWVTFVISGMHGWAFVGLLGVLAWGLVFEASGRLTATQWRNVQRAIAVAALVQVAWMGLQAAGGDRVFVAIANVGTPHAHPDPRLAVPVVGLFSNPMDTGIFLAMSAPAMAAVHPVLGVVGAVAALTMRSTAALAAVLVFGLLALGARSWRAGVLGLAAGAALAVGYVSLIDPQGLGHRPMIWSAAWSALWLKPWAGWGLNAVDHHLVVTSSVGRWNFLFSEWLQWALETGLIGAGLVAGYVVWLAARLVRTWPAGRALLAPAGMLFVLSLASIPFRIGPVALLAALYLGRLHAEVTA